MRNLPPLGSLRAFEAAARRLSFREAGAELGVTPTAISHQIRLLEDICGQPLFRRHPRPLVLTGAGERLFPAIRNGFDAFALEVWTGDEFYKLRSLDEAILPLLQMPDLGVGLGEKTERARRVHDGSGSTKHREPSREHREAILRLSKCCQ